MRFSRKLRCLFTISIFLVTFAGVRAGSIDSYFGAGIDGSETHIMRAIDSMPPAIPAIKETEEHTESRIFIEELFFAVVIAVAFIPKKKISFVAMQARNARLILSKYLKSLVKRQSLP